jgi:hypothetical protein
MILSILALFWGMFFSKKNIMIGLQGSDFIVLYKTMKDFNWETKLHHSFTSLHHNTVNYLQKVSLQLLISKEQLAAVKFSALTIIHIHAVLCEKRTLLHEQLIHAKSKREANQLSDDIIALTTTIKSIENLAIETDLNDNDFEIYSKNIILLK